MVCLHGTSGGRGRTAGVGADYPRYTLELAERSYVKIAPDYTLIGDNQTDPEAYRFVDTAMGFTPIYTGQQRCSKLVRLSAAILALFPPDQQPSGINRLRSSRRS